ncbi:hypothetical protein D9M68_773470 [compost metagenome]
MFGQALPTGDEVGGVGRLGQALEQRLHQLGVGAFGIGLPGFQSVAQGHQRIDFGDDAMLFGDARKRKGYSLPLSFIQNRNGCARRFTPGFSLKVC